MTEKRQSALREAKNQISAALHCVGEIHTASVNDMQGTDPNSAGWNELEHNLDKLELAMEYLADAKRVLVEYGFRVTESEA